MSKIGPCKTWVKYGGPTDKGKPCVFPFIFNGKKYEKCKKWGSVSWCATKTTKDGTLVLGRWGICNKNCPGSTGRYISSTENSLRFSTIEIIIHIFWD